MHPVPSFIDSPQNKVIRQRKHRRGYRQSHTREMSPSELRAVRAGVEPSPCNGTKIANRCVQAHTNGSFRLIAEIVRGPCVCGRVRGVDTGNRNADACILAAQFGLGQRG